MEINSVQNQSTANRSKPADETPAQQQKSVRNQAILQASLEVSLSSGNDSLALLYRTAVTELNKALEADLGPPPVVAPVEDFVQRRAQHKLVVAPD